MAELLLVAVIFGSVALIAFLLKVTNIIRD